MPQGAPSPRGGCFQLVVVVPVDVIGGVHNKQNSRGKAPVQHTAHAHATTGTRSAVANCSVQSPAVATLLTANG